MVGSECVRRQLGIILLLCSLAWMGATRIAFASSYYGQVMFGGLPVPGVTITAVHGEKKFTVTSDESGRYSFDDLPDGQWNIEVSLQCFAPIRADVTIALQTVPGKWELTLLPMPELLAVAKPERPEIAAPPNVQAAATQPAPAANAPVGIPKPAEETDEQSSDGFLVNGSVNNAATSQFSLNQAFGNKRGNSRNLYNGGLAFAFDN